MSYTLTTIAGLIQTVYDGMLAKTLNEQSPAYQSLQSRNKIKTVKKNYLRWPMVSNEYDDATNIVDGGALPDADIEQYQGAALTWAIYIKIIRAGRVVQLGAQNAEEWFKSAEGSGMLEQQLNRVLPTMARSIHKHIVALDSSTNGLTCLGDAVGKTTNTYAGLLRTTYTNWAPHVSHNSGTDRSLTTTLMDGMMNTLRNTRGARTSEIWCGNTAWRALRDLIHTTWPARNNDPRTLYGSARAIYWEDIPALDMPDMDANAMFFLDHETDDGIELCKQHDSDFIIRPESTNAYDDRMSAAGHYQLRVNNPWVQGALLDVQ